MSKTDIYHRVKIDNNVGRVIINIFDKIKRISDIRKKLVRALRYQNPNTREILTNIRYMFFHALIFLNFDVKHYIYIKIEVRNYTIIKVICQFT